MRHLCPECGSGNIKIKATSEPEYPDAVINIRAEVKDGKVAVGFVVKGSYHISEFKGTCENGHVIELDDLMETVHGEDIVEAISVNDETHVVTRELK